MFYSFLDSKHNSSNDDSVDDLPGSAVELESKNKVIDLNCFIIEVCFSLELLYIILVKINIMMYNNLGECFICSSWKS